MDQSSDKYIQDLKDLNIPQIRKLGKKIVKDIPQKEALHLASQLLKRNDRHSKRLGIHILTFSKNRPESELRNAIRNFSDGDDWDLREEGASTLKYLIVEDFEKWFPVLKEFVNSKSVNLNRAAIVGSMASKIKEPEAKKISLEIYEPMLKSKDRYVMVNLGPFAIGSHLLRCFPDIGFKYLDKWVRIDDEYARWNVIMAFSQSAGKRYPNEAKRYINLVEDDKRKMVQRAVRTVSRKLS